jgi:predicted MFS family arabinose efflux permease
VQRAITLVSASYWAGNVLSPALGGWIGGGLGLRQVFGVAVIAFMASTLALLPLKPQPLSHPAAGESRYGLLFRNQRFLGFLALVFVAMVPMQLGVPFLPNYMADVRHLRVEAIGLLGSVNSLGVVLVNVTLGQRIPRRGFLFGQALIGISMLLVLFAAGAAWYGLAYFCQAGWNLARSMATAQVGRVVEKQEIGLAYGITETMSGAAIIIASQVAGLLYARSAALPFQVSLVLVGLALPLVWWLAPRRDAHSLEPATAAVTDGSKP